LLTGAKNSKVLVGSPVVAKDLAKACVSVWVAVEETGRNNQWFEEIFLVVLFLILSARFEKLEIRQSVMSLFKSLRGVDWFMRAVSDLWKTEK